MGQHVLNSSASGIWIAVYTALELGAHSGASHYDGGGLMVQYIPRMKASLLLSLALFAGACAKTDNTAAADSALNKDIQLANRDTAAQPALTDVPGTATNPAPATTTKTTTRTTTTRTPTTTTKKPT